MVPIITQASAPTNWSHSFFSIMGPGMNSLARRKYTMYVVETMISTQPTIFCLLIKACFPGAPPR